MKAMTVYELDTLVREHQPNFRLFDWQEVEDMRNSLAAYGLAVSEFQSLTVRQRKKLEAVSVVMESLKSKKMYEASDALREALREV